jgi:hypothetical protein
MFLFSNSNPEWLEGCVIPVSRLSYQYNEEKGQMMLGKCADLRSFALLVRSQCLAGDKLHTFQLGVVAATLWK